MMSRKYATQKPLPQLVLPKVLEKFQRIERVCNGQCAPYIAACKGRDIAGCYRDSAYCCACNLQQAPTSPERLACRQCVQRFTSLAKAPSLDKPGQHP